MGESRSVRGRSKPRVSPALVTDCGLHILFGLISDPPPPSLLDDFQIAKANGGFEFLILLPSLLE